MNYCLPLLLMLSLALSCKKKNSGDEGQSGPKPTISIDDHSQLEGTGGTTTFSFTVRLSRAYNEVVTVTYGTTDGLAKAGDDYTAVSGQTLSFAAGETQKPIQISIVADDMREPDEDFKVNLSAPVNATISDGEATVTIRNDDQKIPMTDEGYQAPTSYAGYDLVWQDEFNGSSLDQNSWSHQNGDGCPGICGWGNNELEWYTDRPENIFFQDGKMVIEARQETYSGKNYTSSKILTSGKKTFKYGRIDFRAKLPIGKGIWPAFWMLPKPNALGGWPASGEIDIMEMVGHQPNLLVGTLHYGPGPGSTQAGKSHPIPSGTLADKFHVFSLEWKEDQISWFLDGELFSHYTKTDLLNRNPAAVYPFNEEFYFIINLAVGGNWPGSPDASTVFPQFLIVDYLRVYQQ